MPSNRLSPSLTIHILGSTTSLANNSMQTNESSKSNLKVFGITTFSQRRRRETLSSSFKSSLVSGGDLSGDDGIISRFKERFSMGFLASSNYNIGQVIDQDQDQNTSFVNFSSSSKQEYEKSVVHRKASILSSNHLMMDSPITGTFLSISEFDNNLNLSSESSTIHQDQDQHHQDNLHFKRIESILTYPTSSSSSATVRQKEEVQLPKKLLLPTIVVNSNNNKRSYICPWETISPSSLFHRRQQQQYPSTNNKFLDLEKQLPSLTSTTTTTTRRNRFLIFLKKLPLFIILLLISLILIVLNLLIIDIQYLPFINTTTTITTLQPLSNQIHPTTIISNTGSSTKSFLEPFDPVLTISSSSSSTTRVKSIRESVTFIPITTSTPY